MSNAVQRYIRVLLIVTIITNNGYVSANTYVYGNNDHHYSQRGIHMNFPNNSGYMPLNNFSHFRSLRINKELLEIEAQLRDRFMLHDKHIQSLVRLAAFGSDESSQWATEMLKRILDGETIEDMRTGNIWGALAPAQLLTTGDLHLFDQVNGVPWKIHLNALTRGLLLTGIQGGGKTRLLIWLCMQLDQFGIPFFILDPKLGLKDWAGFLNAKYIDADDISIDFSPPPRLTYEQFLPSLMSPLGDIVGLIYGTEILQEAAQICIGLKKQYNQRTGRDTQISLFDLYQAVPFVKDVSKGRRMGYREAVSTSIGRILYGSGSLFQCREGIDLATLFNHNVILGCRSITDDFAAKFLALYLLYWLYESERFSPPCDSLKRILIFDDASRYLSIRGGFDAASTTSPFTNIFSNLRSSGNGVVAVTQIPHLADPGILALSHTIACVGGLHYGKDTKLLADMMGLDETQRAGLSKLTRREVIGFSAGADFRNIVHGRTCDVPNRNGDRHG